MSDHFPKGEWKTKGGQSMVSMNRFRQALRIRWFRILLLILFSLCGLPSARLGSTQKSYDPPCTALALRCPSYVISGAAPIKLISDLFGAKEILGDEGMKRLSYEWQISGARITSGQGTPDVVLDATGAEGSKSGCINVTLRVKGVPPTCESVKSCTLRFDYDCSSPTHFDDKYGAVSAKVEEVHLDRISELLRERGSNSLLYIVAYAGRRACISEAQWRGSRAKKYLIETRRIQDGRIVVVDGGFRENLAIELYVLSKSACGPLPAPTVRASEVQISGLCANR